MPTNAQLAAKMLRDASLFFRQVGEQNPPVADQMNQNAQVYDQVAQMVETDPTAEVPAQAPEGEQPPQE
ncbi:hypothetical protein CP97_12575 [Aurantiacibacter atlanticus]|uniref:Uncharacterized protein n=1 Tax=Aurantiacibacter atlanticus TaxID=1648404 RepID=A0A0H4VZU4_9SPHN|nr:hypothetical protein [Aurantiacibacter atlanticus]AKQ42693.1 hypothetical protein CP97_12575 [Aurantiacibacter atlanticus]MDF1834424.1 hypothetical protein [Alteraurantiacibacter sp. bin_em_oilr2.035]